ncbi:hypothetical protein HMPREF1635_02185 [Clostridiales bacterium S5-A14a]|nr:hypothetical protein HMPREF1635_02185 [Clostridiales bacterium S5-A14a]
MYFIYCDGEKIYDLRDESLLLVSPKLALEDNASGSLSFNIGTYNEHFDKIKLMASKIEVFQDKEKIFEGRPIDSHENFNKTISYQFEGALAYLCDSMQRAKKYQGITVEKYLSDLLEIHNAQVSEDRQFKLGVVTVKDSNDYVYKYTNYESTLDVIKSDLLKTYGGHLRIRYENGTRYLDYLKDWARTSAQRIELNSNLLDIAKNYDATKIATAVVPRGASLEKDPSDSSPLEKRVDITSVNGGLDYVQSDEAVKKYGFICKTVTWDNVSVPANLKRKASEYLSDTQFENLQLEVKAFDLSMVSDVDNIRLLDEVRVISKPHGLDRLFPVTKLELHLDDPAQNTFSLGAQEVKRSVSTGVAKVQEKSIEIEKKVETVEQKFDNYPTKREVSAEIETAEDSITISVSEKTKKEINGKLKDYYTRSQIDVKTDSIESEVRTKIDEREFGTKIVQNAESVKIAWNDGTRVLDFQSYGMDIYDYSKTSSSLRARLDEKGYHFYRSGYYLGKIGTNVYVDDASKKGLVFDLTYDGAYMSWATQNSASDSLYTHKFAYVSRGFATYSSDTLNAGCNLDMHNFQIRNIGNGMNATVVGMLPTSIGSNGVVSNWTTNFRLVFRDGLLTEATV